MASFNAVPDHPVGKLVLVRVTEYDEDEVKSLKSLTRPTAEYVPVHLENVMVVKRAALTLYRQLSSALYSSSTALNAS